MYCNFITIFFRLQRYLSIILIITMIFFSTSVLAGGDKDYKIRTVVIDAGHGGKDPGALGKRGKEKDIALNIALKLGGYIERLLPDVKVIYTRKTDVFVELYKRAEIANTNNADLFISLHVNSNPNPRPKGTETFVMGLHKSTENLDVAKKENSVILKEDNYQAQYEGFDPSSPESHIVFSLYQNANLEQSLSLAANTQSQFKDRVGRIDRGVKQAGFLVLWKTTMPSILIEAGFISNQSEENYLLSKQGQDYIASGIYRAFRDYKLEVERKCSATIAVKAAPEEIYFKVQISSSKKSIKIDAKKFKGLNNVDENLIDGIYKYTVGRENDVDKIIEVQNEARKKFPDAFVIAFKNGVKISYKRALKEIRNN